MTETNAESLVEIEALLNEQREFPPPEAFRAGALIRNESVYDEAERDPEAFWMRLAHEFVGWFRKPSKGLEWDPPHCTWFADGELNVAWNCLDKQLEAGRGDQVAYHWVGEPEGETRDITYAELLASVCKLANGLRRLGIGKGDRVGIYMGMVPELPIAMLACARIGAPHVVVFGGFSAESLGERLRSTEAKLLITQDEAWRKGGRVPLKENADAAVAASAMIESVIVYKRTGCDVAWKDDRDVWWHDVVEIESDQCEPERLSAEDPLFLLHTSGTTAKPKGALHTTGAFPLPPSERSRRAASASPSRRTRAKRGAMSTSCTASIEHPQIESCGWFCSRVRQSERTSSRAPPPVSASRGSQRSSSSRSQATFSCLIHTRMELTPRRIGR